MARPPAGSASGDTEDWMTQLIRIGHSPDADDAFMFYAMTHGKVTIPGVRIEHVLEDIESLNRRAGPPRSSRSPRCRAPRTRPSRIGIV